MKKLCLLLFVAGCGGIALPSHVVVEQTKMCLDDGHGVELVYNDKKVIVQVACVPKSDDQ